MDVLLYTLVICTLLIISFAIAYFKLKNSCYYYELISDMYSISVDVELSDRINTGHPNHLSYFQDIFVEQSSISENSTDSMEIIN